MAKRSRSASFDAVYPFDQEAGPLKNGALNVTPQAPPQTPPSNTLLNPVYPFGYQESLINDGKLVVTGNVTSLVQTGQGLQFNDKGQLSVSPNIAEALRTSAPVTNSSGTLGLNVGTGLKVQGGNLTIASAAAGLIPVSAPVTHSADSIGLNVGAGLEVTGGQLVATYTQIPTAAPLTNSQGTLGLEVGNGLQVSANALAVNAAAPLSVTGGSLTLSLGNELTVANQALGLKRYCFAWTGTNQDSSFSFHGKNMKIFLALERVGELVYGTFAAYSSVNLSKGDMFNINVWFNSNGTVNSQGTYRGPFGPRASETTASSTPSPNQKGLVPSSAYSSLPNATALTVGVNTTNLYGSGLTYGKLFIFYNRSNPSNTAGGLTFRYVLTDVEATQFSPDLVNFCYLGANLD